MNLESIAIPCIGVRRAGFSFERVGKIMAEVISAPYNKSLEYDLCNRHWIQLKDMDGWEELGRQINENIRFYLNRKD